MPTGYTAAVQSGEAGPKEFLVRLAEAFGIGGDRDYDADAEVARVHRQLAEYQQQLDDLQALSPEQAEVHAQASYAKAVDRWADYRKRQAADRDRYEKVLKAVKAWDVPVEIEPIKKYAIEQLVQSIKHDCEGGGYDIPVLLSGREWLNKEMRLAARMVDSYTETVAQTEQQATEKKDRARKFAEAVGRV